MRPLDLKQMKLSGFEPDPDLQWEKIGDIAAPDDGVDANNYDGSYVIPVAIDEHRVLVIDDQVHNDISENFVRVFDTRTKEWSNEELPSLNQPRSGFSCVVCNGKNYVIGGIHNEGEYLNSIECLDLSASPRQWVTMDQMLGTARCDCKCVAIGTQVLILGGFGEGNDKLVSVEILNTETEQLIHGPDLPPYHGFIPAGAVSDKLLMFAKSIEGDGDIGEIHSLQHEQPNSTWETTLFSLRNETLVFEPIVIGECILLSRLSAYDTKRDRWWTLPKSPFERWQWAAVGGTEVVAFTEKGIYQLKLKLGVHPPTAVMPTSIARINRSMLFSPDFSDVTFACPGGIEIPAHRNILAANNPYFRAYFSGPWVEQHPDGRWETEKSGDVVYALLSIMYTGEAPMELSDAHMLEFLETSYEFQLDSDLLRVCQAKCIANISVSNVKDLLLSAKLHNASFLFDAAFKFVCEHFAEVAADPKFATDVAKTDGELWREIVEVSHKPSRKRPRSGDM